MGMLPGQCKVDGKSNEITAIAELLCGERPAMAFNFMGYETNTPSIRPVPHAA